MKRLIWILFFSISSCSGVSKVSSIFLIPHDYSELKEKELDKDHLFFEGTYEVYFYSPQCAVCHSIKNEVVSYGLNHSYFYLFNVDEDIPIREGSCVGAKSYEEIFIKGTPSLFFFSSKQVSQVITGKSAILEYFKTKNENN